MPAGSWEASPVPLVRMQTGGGAVRRLLQWMSQDDPALYEHSLQVWALTRQLAASWFPEGEEQTAIELSALLHDVGKLTIPRTLLDKPGNLTPQEWTVMQQHCAAGAHQIRQMQIDDRVALLVYHHHERWDGQGYPEKLAGTAIPRGARLLAIADAFVTMTTTRSYQDARSVRAAMQELERNAGTQFDPLLVLGFIACLRNQQDSENLVRGMMKERDSGAPIQVSAHFALRGVEPLSETNDYRSRPVRLYSRRV